MKAEVLGLPRGRPLTRADLENLPEDGHRYELIDGTLLVSPAPRVNHQIAVSSLLRALSAAAPREFLVLSAPLDVSLADDTVLEPDILVAPRSAFTEHDLPAAPLLAIEVLSPSTALVDLNLKRARLEQAGCSHYWVVDADKPSIRAWALDAHGAYVEVAHAAGEDELVLTEPFPIRISPARLVD